MGAVLARERSVNRGLLYRGQAYGIAMACVFDDKRPERSRNTQFAILFRMMKAPSLVGDPKDHIKHKDRKPNTRVILETMVFRVFMFMFSFGPLRLLKASTLAVPSPLETARTQQDGLWVLLIYSLHTTDSIYFRMVVNSAAACALANVITWCLLAR